MFILSFKGQNTTLRHSKVLWRSQKHFTQALNVKKDNIQFTVPLVTTENMYILMHFPFIYALVKKLL